MNKNLIKVKEFHDIFQVPVLDKPEIPSKERCELRINLIQEELDELKEALENNDIVEVIDALCDIQYIVNGSIIEFGMQDIFKKSFNEVHRSNMSKACNTIEEANQTVNFYFDKDKTDAYIKEVNGKWIVYRRSDNKVLKSINYSPANLKDIIYG